MNDKIAPSTGAKDAAEFIAQLGAEAAGVTIEHVAPPVMIGMPDSVPIGVVHGRQPSLLDLSQYFERYRTRPEQKRGVATALTFESFCDLTNRHKTEHSAVFANTEWREPSLTAVIDYHENVPDGLAENGKHRVHYAFPLSEEWKTWIKGDGQKMTQADFAYFLEDRVAELSSPFEAEVITYQRDFATTVATPSQLVQLSRGLQVHVGTKVKAMHTLQSGEGQIQWEESHSDADGKALKVPGIFILQIAPFFMGEKIRVPVRLRYRPSGGEVIWTYHIYRPDQAITEHVRATLAEARERTGLPAYEGKPEMAA